jgi:hypothetical protein
MAEASSSSTSPRRNLKHKAQASQSGAQRDNPVVASLLQKSPHPFSSIALSPNREFAVTARKDALLIVQVGPLGIVPFKSIPIAQHFQTKVSTVNERRSSVGHTSSGRGNGNNNMGRIYEDVRDSFAPYAFGHGQRTGSSQASSNNINVILTDVAWSNPTGEIPQTVGDINAQSTSSTKKNKNNKAKDDNKAPKTDTGTGTSLIAAAGSNGVIVVWTAETLLGEESGHFPKPDAILSQHVRAVNKLAWHPRRPGLLLSASQDGTVIIWERKLEVATTTERQRQSKQSTKQGFSLFGGMNSQSNQKQSYSWQCRGTFEPKSEAVRDIRWSPFYHDGKCLYCVACFPFFYFVLKS